MSKEKNIEDMSIEELKGKVEELEDEIEMLDEAVDAYYIEINKREEAKE